MAPSAPINQSATAKPQPRQLQTPIYSTKPKGNGWLKFLRVILYAISIVGLAIGIGLVKSSACEHGTGLLTVAIDPK